MALSVAHCIMFSKIELVKQEQRDIIALRADKRAKELQALHKVIHRKKDSDILEYIFFFQVFLVGTFVSAMYYA
jgi:hypothetical protein